MGSAFHLEAQVRNHSGSSASRRLRKQNRIPAIIYGCSEAPQNISLITKDVVKATGQEGFYSQILTLSVDGKQQKVIVRDLARHPFKPHILHMDFLRISEKEKISVRVPIHVLGEDKAPGIKQGGGMLSKLMIDVEVSCIPSKLPEFIEVDVSNLKLGHAIHLSDLKLPNDVEIAAFLHGTDEDKAAHDSPVVNITAMRVTADEPEETTEPTAEDGAGTDVPAGKGAEDK